VSAIEERRQQAREVFYDAPGFVADPDDNLRQAIESATQVRITDNLINDLADVTFAGGFLTRRALVCAAFEAAGFEVME
jgi:hypothetical protein